MSEESPVVDDECSASNGLGLLPPPQAGEGTLGLSSAQLVRPAPTYGKRTVRVPIG